MQPSMILSQTVAIVVLIYDSLIGQPRVRHWLLYIIPNEWKGGIEGSHFGNVRCLVKWGTVVLW